MIVVKKSTIAVLALSSGLAYAGEMGPVCVPGDVTMPCDQSGWVFGAQALYLKPAYTLDVDYATGFTDSANIRHWNGFSPDWGWGFKIEAAYLFSTGNDINVNWYHYSKITNHTIQVGTSASYVNLSTELEPKWDAVNAEFGQRVNFGPLKNLRVFAGGEFTRISNVYYLTYLNDSNTTLVDSIHMKFNGFGPRAGADFAYRVIGGLDLTANAAGSVIVGNSSFSTNTFVHLDTEGGSTGSQTRIVPELEGKLGLQYTYGFAQGDLVVNAGYMWQNYFNVQEYLTVHGNGGGGSFGIQGPYVGVKYLGYV